MKRMLVIIAAVVCACAAATPRHAVAETPDYWQLSESWRFGAGINGYLPDVGLKTTLPNGVDSDIQIDIGTILDHMKMAFAGVAEAQKGRWGAFTDVLYMDLGGAPSKTRNFTLGSESLPADVSAKVTVDMKATIWTFAGSYRALTSPRSALDVFAGTRLFDVTVNQDWRLTGNIGSIPLPDRSGHGETNSSVWDAIIGVKGRFALNADRTWFVPCYLDVGTRDSELTWQILGGIGYTFDWGDVTATWRYLDYKTGASTGIEEENMSGPQIAYAYRW